jgi:hypothetical protein
MDYRRDAIDRLPETVRPQGDSDEEQKIKYKHHRFANGTLNYYIDRCDYLAAYTVAFSLLEDRLRAMAIVKQRDVLGHDNYESFGIIELARVVGHNYPKTEENLIFVENIKTVIFNRNKLLHEAMWRINAIALKDVEDVIGLRDIVASELEKMKRQVQKQKKQNQSKLTD